MKAKITTYQQASLRDWHWIHSCRISCPIESCACSYWRENIAVGMVTKPIHENSSKRSDPEDVIWFETARLVPADHKSEVDQTEKKTGIHRNMNKHMSYAEEKSPPITSRILTNASKYWST